MPPPPQPQPQLNKWKLLPESVSRALVNPLVVVTIMTTVALILGVLSLASDPPSKKILVVCGIIGVFGLLAVIYEVRRLYRLDMARIFLSRLLAEGKAITMEVGVSKGARTEALLGQWCSEVEAVLRKYLDESYVVRFHLGGSLAQDPASMTPWKNWHRLETLAQFLRELR